MCPLIDSWSKAAQDFAILTGWMGAVLVLLPFCTAVALVLQACAKGLLLPAALAGLLLKRRPPWWAAVGAMGVGFASVWYASGLGSLSVTGDGCRDLVPLYAAALLAPLTVLAGAETRRRRLLGARQAAAPADDSEPMRWGLAILLGAASLAVFFQLSLGMIGVWLDVETGLSQRLGDHHLTAAPRLLRNLHIHVPQALSLAGACAASLALLGRREALITLATAFFFLVPTLLLRGG